MFGLDVYAHKKAGFCIIIGHFCEIVFLVQKVLHVLMDFAILTIKFYACTI